MALDQETVKRIATLARLKISDERIPSVEQDLNRILQFIDQLNEVDTTGIEPMGSATVSSLPLRDDDVTDGGYVEKILANAPEVACNMFVVPKVVE